VGRRMPGPAVIAWCAAAGFAVLVLFQAAIVLGAPVGRFSYGGSHPGRLPTHLRVVSVAAVAVWALAALIVLQRGGEIDGLFPYGFVRLATWVLVGFLTLSVPLNALSRSPGERWWALFAAVLATLCFLLARGTYAG
jgi:hypothetical protein